MALVDDGSVRVGWPGAPGCTTTGGAGSACCAQTGSENKLTRILPAISPLRHAETFITYGSLCLLLALKVLIDFEWSSIDGAHLITKPLQGSLPVLGSKFTAGFAAGKGSRF